jgi:putative flippase GtrA
MASAPIDVIGLKHRYGRYMAFLLVGGFGFVLYLAISNGVHYLFGVEEAWSAVIGSVLPIWPIYQLQRRVTFRQRTARANALPAYAALQAGNAMLVGALSALGSRTSLPGYMIFVLAGVAGVIASYLVQSRLIFRKT